MMIRMLGHSIDLPAIVLGVIEFLIMFSLAFLLHGILAAKSYSVSRDSPYLSASLIAGTASIGLMSVGLYSRTHFLRWEDALSRAVVILPLVTVIMLLVIEVYDQWIGVIPRRGNYLLSGLTMLIFTPILIGGRRLFVLIVDRTGLFIRRVLVLGSGPRAAKVQKLSQRFRYRSLIVVGYVSLDPVDATSPLEMPPVDSPEDRRAGPRGELYAIEAAELLSLCQRLNIDEVIVASDERAGLPVRELLKCKLAGIAVTEYISFWERETGQIDLAEIPPGWLIFSTGFRMGAVRVVVKRSMDIAIGLTLLVLSAPIMLVTALVIALQGGGPLFYSQERIGLRGKPFTIFKFRSMRVDAEKDGPTWAAKNDSRVTPVGAFIRRVRIDELPQIFNVLLGDMAIVGPRPERPVFVEALAEKIPFYQERHLAKPGITGWAQINYPYGASDKDAEAKLAYDLYYIKNRNTFLDVVIILQTLEVLLWNSGAR